MSEIVSDSANEYSETPEAKRIGSGSTSKQSPTPPVRVGLELPDHPTESRLSATPAPRTVMDQPVLSPSASQALRVSPLPIFTNTVDEETTFNVREIAKSPAIAITALMYLRNKMKNQRRGLDKPQLDIIITAIHIYGKTYPEIFFFGIDCLRTSHQYTKNVAHIPILSLALQFCINAINFLRSKSDSNEYLIFSSFGLLATVADGRNLEWNQAELQNATDLMDLITSEFLSTLSVDTCAVIIFSVANLSTIICREADFKNIFFRQNFFEFCASHAPASPAESAEQIVPYQVYCVLYLVSIIRSKDGKRGDVIERLFDPSIVRGVTNSLVQFLNTRYCLIILVSFLASLVNSAIRLSGPRKTAGPSSEDDDEDDSFGGMLLSAFSGSGLNSNLSAIVTKRLAPLVQAINVEILDDIFTSYTDSETSSESEIPVAIMAIGVGLVQYYTSRPRGSTDAAITLSVIRKWAVAGSTSSHPVLVAGGLYLTGVIAEHTGEKFDSLVSFEALDVALDLLVSVSPKWAGDQVFASLPVRVIISDKICDKLFSSIIFNPKIFLIEKIKILFFKKFSMKEIFLRVFATIHELASVDDIREIARVCCQMIVALKAKKSFAEIQDEVVMIESERFKVGGTKGGFKAWVLVAIQRCSSNQQTLEMLLFILFETFLNKPVVASTAQGDKIREIIIQSIDDENGRGIARAIFAGSKGIHWKPPGMHIATRISVRMSNRPISVLELFIDATTVPRDQEVLDPTIEPESEPVEEMSPTKPDNSSTEVGWIDSAANWFLDMAVGDDDSSDGDDKDHAEAHPTEKEEIDPTVEEQPSKIVNPVPHILPVATLPEKPEPVAPPASKSAHPPVKAVTPANAHKVVPGGKLSVKPMVKKPGAMPLYKVPQGKQPMVKKAVPKPPPPPPVPELITEAEPEEKKEKKSKKKKSETPPPEQSWGDYLGGFAWGAQEEEPKEKKKKKKKKDSDDEGNKKPPAPIAKQPVPVKPVPKMAPKPGMVYLKAKPGPPGKVVPKQGPVAMAPKKAQIPVEK